MNNYTHVTKLNARSRYYLFILTTIGVLIFWVYMESIDEDITVKKLGTILDVYRDRKMGKSVVKEKIIKEEIVNSPENIPGFNDYPKMAML